jgi:hypothetical protein
MKLSNENAMRNAKAVTDKPTPTAPMTRMIKDLVTMHQDLPSPCRKLSRWCNEHRLAVNRCTETTSSSDNTSLVVDTFQVFLVGEDHVIALVKWSDTVLNLSSFMLTTDQASVIPQ